MLGATETLIGTIVKVCREDTIFYLFFPYFLSVSSCPLPNVDCKTVTLFLRIQVRRASSQKQVQSQDKRGGRDWGEKLKLPLNRF